MRFDEPENYQYLTPRVVRGWTLPDVDGTGAERVSRFEDAQYLVEMARERYHWTIGPSAVTADIAPAYEETGYPLVRRILRELANAVTGRFGSGDDFPQIRALGDPYAVDAWLIPADADLATRTASAAHAFQTMSSYLPSVPSEWKQGLALDRVTPAGYASRRVPNTSEVPFPESCDTYRCLFRDLGNMKRWLLRCSCGGQCHASGFDASVAPADGVSHIVGPVQVGGEYYGKQHFDSPEYGTDWEYSADETDGKLCWDARSNSNMTAVYLWSRSSNSTSLSTLIGTFRFYIRTPFYFKGYPNEDDTYYAVGGSKLYVAAGASVEFDWGEGEGYDIGAFDILFMYSLADLGVSATVLDDTAYYDGYFDVTTTAAFLGSLAENAEELARQHAETYGIPSAARLRRLSLRLGELYLDTGAIELYSNVPASWTWQPPAN